MRRQASAVLRCFSDIAPKPSPQHGDRWGVWEYDATNLVLRNAPRDYEIDLEECTTSAKLLDWIFQLGNKAWMTPRDLGDMLLALDDLLSPQANLCSFGVDKKFDVTKHLRKKAGY